VAIVAATMMLLGISSSAHAVARSSTGNFALAEDGVSAGQASGHVEAGRPLAAPVPFSCEVNGPSYNGAYFGDGGSPAMLTSLVWTGSGTGFCTAPMTSMLYTVFAIDPQGGSHTIALGSCIECVQVTAATSGYTCAQGTTIATNCAGAWQVGYRAVVTAPPGSPFSSGTGSCVAAVTTMTCTATAFVGVAPLFAPSSQPCTAARAPATDSAHRTATQAGAACYNYPPSGNVQLDLRAIQDIRDTHFPGGSKVDSSKGLFLSTVTNRDLAKVLDTGLQDSGSWALNENNYYEKTFPYSGVGTKSPQAGGGPSHTITLVVAKFNDPDTSLSDVITMYPANA
jgi:hypothetical protein